MNALELVQECAKRIGIMIPNTIVQTTTPDTSAIDYDANLLVSYMNAAIKQQMMVNILRKNVYYSYSLIEPDNAASVHFDGYQTGDPLPDPDAYVNFIINIEKECPSFVKLMGDGFIVRIIYYDNNVSATYKQIGQYVFRQFTDTDAVTFLPTAIGYTNPEELISSDENIDDVRNQRKEHYKNLPSDKQKILVSSDKRESGFVYLGNDIGNSMFYFINNMIPFRELYNIETGTNNITQGVVYFEYVSNYGILDKNRTPKENITADDDLILVNQELVMLNTIIMYKTYYGMDYQLELGQQKAIVDALQQNQENVQIVTLNKKRYEQDRRL